MRLGDEFLEQKRVSCKPKGLGYPNFRGARAILRRGIYEGRF